jgi:hypothetical protein
MNSIPYSIHSDEPADMDGLGREELSKEVALAAATNQPPLVLGVHGDWGSGKTTFMRHVSEKLNQGAYQNRLITIWFDAWRYHNEPAPIVALLHEMRRQFPPFEKGIGKAAKISNVAFRAVLSSLDQAAKLVGMESLPFSPDKIQSIGEQWEKERLEVQLAADTLQEYLRHAIDALLPDAADSPTPRVVIFIDDLDRCNPEMAYRLLEGLKIYLNLKNCVFILAMNQQVITDAIAQAMKKEEPDARVKLRAEAYLEKLCANIWRIPPPAKPHEYFTALLNFTDAVPKTAVDNAVLNSRGFLPPNPRRLKALANLYNRLWPKAKALGIAQGNEEHLSLRVLIVAYVYQFHSELFHRWRHDPFFFEEMKRWLSTGSADEKKELHFAALTLPTRSTTDANQPTPVPTIKGNYPDPTTPGVFWIAPLLQGPLANDIPDDYRPLLELENA